MRAIDARFVRAMVAVTCLSGCAGNPAPRGWRPPAVEVQRSPRGGWIIVETVVPAAANSGILQGELIAVDETTVHVLTSAGLQSVPRTSTHRITLVGYSPSAAALAGWAAAGGVSTLSHGGFLLLTAPMWTVAGIAAFVNEKHAGVVHDAHLARRFARFPQGLPPGFDPKSLGTLPSVTR